MADRRDRPARLQILGNASPGLIGMNAETLAGRVEIVEQLDALVAGLR